MEKDMQGYRPKKRGPQIMDTSAQLEWRNTKSKTATDDSLLTDNRKKAKEFNKHFASTNTLSNTRIDAGMKRNLTHKERSHPPNIHSGFTQALTMAELKAELIKLKPHNARVVIKSPLG